MKKFLIIGGLVVAMQWSTAISTQSAWPVIDTGSIAQAKIQVVKLNEQIQQMQDQLAMLTDMKSELEAQLKAFGEFGKIQIPTLNFTKISGQLTNNMTCLIPDYKKLMPSLENKEINLNSICSRGGAYKSGLVVHGNDLSGKTPTEQRAVVRDIKEQRKTMVTDATTKGLAHADMALESSTETVKAAQELKNSAANTEDMNDRLQVVSETNIAILQGQAVTNQLLAQILKVNSAVAIQLAVPIQNSLANEMEE